MRKQNAEFKTAFTSEAESDLKNTDYFGFVELDDFACYVMADGIDDQTDAMSAKLAVSAVVSAFSEGPSMKKRTLNVCLKAANKALLQAKSKRKLKASVLIVLTNYVKLRYGQAGNIRFHLYRNGFLTCQSIDQSLTADLVKEERVEQDKVSIHEERNNLYAYLGQDKDFHPYISKKIKLTNADALALYTRGIWEHIDEGELKDAFADATDDPEKTVAEIEELLLSRQPENLSKYTFAAIFVNKVFTDPNRKRKIRRALMTAIPILILAITLTILLAIRYNKKLEGIRRMGQWYEDTIEYIQTDNYIRAEECCREAEKEAGKLKNEKMQQELDRLLKLIETVLEADELLNNKEYAEAQRAFQNAANRSRYVDNLGLDYIKDRQALTANYLSVYDFISLGDALALNLQYDKAEEMYLEAKLLAGKIYFDEGRMAAIDALDRLYGAQKAEKAAADEEMQKQVTQEASAANHVALGDESFAQGDYESAKVYYATALEKYRELDDNIQKETVEEKLKSVKNKLAANAEKEKEAEGYMAKAEEALAAGDLAAAKLYYLLAKDIYASLKEDEKVAEVERKIEALDISQPEKGEKEEEKEKEEGEKENQVQLNVIFGEGAPVSGNGITSKNELTGKIAE